MYNLNTDFKILHQELSSTLSSNGPLIIISPQKDNKYQMDQNRLNH